MVKNFLLPEQCQTKTFSKIPNQETDSFLTHSFSALNNKINICSLHATVIILKTYISIKLFLDVEEIPLVYFEFVIDDLTQMLKIFIFLFPLD